MQIELPDKIRALTAGKPFAADGVGRSGSTVLVYDDMVLKIESPSAAFDRMLRVMEWLQGRLPAPQVLCCEKTGGMNYLLMTRVRGAMSCDTWYLERPALLVSLLAEGLRMLWSIDISDCPVVRDLDAELAEARIRVERGLVNMADSEPGTYGEGGFESPAHLLKWLEENRPAPETVFSHGDYCLPNILLQGERISGFIDLGDAGAGDRWRDIALCYRSLRHNFDGAYGGKVYPDFCPDILFEALGMAPDWEKLRYYTLLDELF